MNRAGLITVLALAFAIAGCMAKAPVDETAKENAPIPVQVTKAISGTVEADTGVSGRLAPSQEVQISPKASGKITNMAVKLGQYVKQGAVLFTLDQTDLMNAVKQAQASYELALANLKQSDNSSNQALEQSKNAVDQAKQTLDDAKRNGLRTEELYRQGAVSMQQYEQAKTAVKNAEAAYANALQGFQAAQKMTGVGVSQASVNQARVALENAREQLANATVRAPISGYVSRIEGAKGEIAGPQMAVVTIVDLDPLVVRAHLSESEITQVKLGSKVKVELPALKQEIMTTVTAVSPTMDQQSKAYPIEISVPNPKGELKADMAARVKFAASETTKPSIVLPKKAVFEENGKKIVYKITGNKAQKLEVVTGAESSELIEITSGLTMGDMVVVRGQTLLKDGAAVEIQKAE